MANSEVLDPRLQAYREQNLKVIERLKLKLMQKKKEARRGTVRT